MMILVCAPLYLYIFSCWLAKPLTLGANIGLSSVLAMTFCIGIITMRTSRSDFLRITRVVGIELCALAVMAMLSILSLLNSSEPFRIFRILFPSLVPFLILAQLLALRSQSPQRVFEIPRVFFWTGLIITTLLLLLASIGLRDLFFGAHRFRGGFENSNQHSVVLATLIPLVLCEISVAKRKRVVVGLIFAFLTLFYLLLRTGSKTALFLGGAVGLLFLFLVNFRSLSLMKRIAFLGGIGMLVLGARLFGLIVVEAIDPVLAEKIRLIFTEGVENYYSIQSRQLLWDEAIRLGKEHWLVGAGAGEMILGLSHAHNLVLDYFRGIGIFGAIAITILCIRILWRCAVKSILVLSGGDSVADRRIWACYVSASLYVVCNQLSDSFGPTTIAALWLIYLPAVITDTFGLGKPIADGNEGGPSNGQAA